MSNFQGRNGSSGVISAMLTVVFVLAIAGGGWFITHRATAAASAPSQTVAFEGWPTTLPTFTPIVVPSATSLPKLTSTPTPTPLPTASPIATPSETERKNIADLATLAVTLSTIQQASQDNPNTAWIWKKLKGTNSVTVQYFAKVKLGIELNDDMFNCSSDTSSAFILRLPPIKVLSIEADWNQSRIVGSSRSIVDDATGLETQAWISADEAIKEHVLKDTELVKTAEHLTELQLEKSLLGQGCKNVSVSFQVPTR